MATKTFVSDNYVPTPRPMPYSKPVPRDECARVPWHTQRTRPSPLIMRQSPAQLAPEVVELSARPPAEVCEAPRDPEIVDLAAPNTWPRRGTPKRVPSRHTAPSPSIYSRCSTARQSEISFGILDYYTRDPSPTPDMYPPTPKVDPAMEKFDFQLVPQTPMPHRAGSVKQAPNDTKAGADRSDPPLVEISPPTSGPRPWVHRKTYSLFPAVTEIPKPAADRAPDAQSPSISAKPPSSNVTSVPSHQQPDPSYRPRKESLSKSIRSRKDSFTSFRSNRRIPLRILSSSSTASASKYTDSTASTASPPQRSRWSDETITSPTAATTPGPLRTSFGSMLAGRDSAQYPACFFEDDDEGAPLRRKFGWKRSLSLTHEQQAKKQRRGRFDEESSLGLWLRRIVLCDGCWSSRDATELL